MYSSGRYGEGVLTWRLPIKKTASKLSANKPAAAKLLVNNKTFAQAIGAMPIRLEAARFSRSWSCVCRKLQSSRLGLTIFTILFLFSCFMPAPVFAERVHWDTDTLRKVLGNDIHLLETLASDSDLVQAVIQSNQQNHTMDDIGSLDRLWIQSEDDHPFKRAILFSAASQILQRYVLTHPMLAELLLTNKQGENVGVYPSATDYWQGDEAQWIDVFSSGSVYIGQPLMDASSGTNVVKVSVPVMADGEVVGVLIGAVRLSHVFYRQIVHPELLGDLAIDPEPLILGYRSPVIPFVLPRVRVMLTDYWIAFG